MSLRQRIQKDVPETEDSDGCAQTEEQDGCSRDGRSRRMSPRRRIQTDVPETEDPDRSLRDGRPGWIGTENIPETEVKMGGPSILAFRFRDIDVCHLPWPYVWRRMSQTDVPETDDRDGGPRRMP